MGDETKDTGQDTPQVVGQSSDSDEGTTSQAKAAEPTFSKAQVDKMLSDAKAEFGRERARLTRESESAKQELSDVKGHLDSTNSRLEAIQSQIDRAELEKARNDPEMVKLYQQRRDVEKQSRDLETQRRTLARDVAQHKADKEAWESERRGATIEAIATKHGLKAEDLSDLGISDTALLDKVAAKVAGKKPGGESSQEGQSDFKPDSGMSSGGIGKPTNEQLEKMTPDQYAAWAKDRFK